MRRNRVLFETACVCSARASEVCGLHVKDLDLRAPACSVNVRFVLVEAMEAEGLGGGGMVAPAFGDGGLHLRWSR